MSDQEALRRIHALVASIIPPDAAAMDAARARQQTLTKPPGSLGRLEDLAAQIAGITRSGAPSVARKAVIVLAGDHGVTAEGVSAYPSEVTPQMALNFLQGGAAINALARAVGARVVVVDVGVAVALEHAGLVQKKVAPGTANMALGPAMTPAQTHAAIVAGAEVLDEQAAVGLDIVATGEMGIGNTTAASALTAVLTGQAVATVTGRGTGIDDTQLAHKVAVIERALHVNAPDPADPLDTLAKVGGLEIAGLVGVVLAAASRHIPIVIDGFIASAAAMVAVKLCPAMQGYLVAGHLSVERGHQVILQELRLTPLLDLGLRLGEGTGAALAMGVVDAAVRAHNEMATFADAHVSDRPRE